MTGGQAPTLGPSFRSITRRPHTGKPTPTLGPRFMLTKASIGSRVSKEEFVTRILMASCALPWKATAQVEHPMSCKDPMARDGQNCHKIRDMGPPAALRL